MASVAVEAVLHRGTAGVPPAIEAIVWGVCEPFRLTYVLDGPASVRAVGCRLSDASRFARPRNGRTGVANMMGWSVAGLLACMAVTPVQAGPVRAAPGGSVTMLPSQVEAGYRQNLRALRTAALRQQAADGGTLSDRHRAALQLRLDRINDLRLRTLHNNNPLAVDANGSPVRVAEPASDWTYNALFLAGVPN